MEDGGWKKIDAVLNRGSALILMLRAKDFQ